MEKHKARLQAELTKARLRRGIASTEALREFINNGYDRRDGLASRPEGKERGAEEKTWSHPRWVRINTLKTSLKEQLATTFLRYRRVNTLVEILHPGLEQDARHILHVDVHIPDLIALPLSTDITTFPGYKQGLLILQDKASCFPAYLLNPQPGWSIIDACAAPGNKTTHLAALMRKQGHQPTTPHIWACERDKSRATTLQKMIDLAGASKAITVKAGQDFLRLNPQQEPWCRIKALLLDPSCSGSGIISRENNSTQFHLPQRQNPIVRSFSRKRPKHQARPHPPTHDIKIPEEEEEEQEQEQEILHHPLQSRLQSLSTFQTTLLTHALAFPSATHITYSTCSLHALENETVVLAALNSDIAAQREWKILKRRDQVPGMAAWPTRGDVMACGGDGELAEACIRCEKGTEEGTQGFFVVGFVRGGGGESEGEGEEEWEGFGEDESDG